MQTIIANKGVRAVLLTKKCIYANDFDVHDVVTKSSARSISFNDDYNAKWKLLSFFLMQSSLIYCHSKSD